MITNSIVAFRSNWYGCTTYARNTRCSDTSSMSSGDSNFQLPMENHFKYLNITCYSCNYILNIKCYSIALEFLVEVHKYRHIVLGIFRWHPSWFDFTASGFYSWEIYSIHKLPMVLAYVVSIFTEHIYYYIYLIEGILQCTSV